MKKIVFLEILVTILFFVIAAQAESEEAFPVHALMDKVSISGVIEVEAGFSDKNDDWEEEDSSDVDLATADLAIDAELSEWITGHVVFSWDCEDDNSVGIDEADITLGGAEKFPFYLKAGRLYVPFGNFETHMVSDPLTLEIGEIRDGAVQVGVDISGFYASGYAFNGDVDKADEEDEIRCFGANAGYAFENETISLDIGAGYISNVLESGMQDLLEGDLKDEVSGLSSHTVLNLGPVGIIGEYVCALDEIENTEGWVHDEPAAWNVELGVTFEVAAEKEVTLAAAYQGTDECAGFLPETRMMGAVGFGFSNFGITLEYAHDEDYDTSDGGTDEDKNIVTLQLALEF